MNLGAHGDRTAAKTPSGRKNRIKAQLAQARVVTANLLQDLDQFLSEIDAINLPQEVCDFPRLQQC